MTVDNLNALSKTHHGMKKLTSSQLEVTIDTPIIPSKTCHGTKKVASPDSEIVVDAPIIPSKTCHGMKKVPLPDSEIVMPQSYEAKLAVARGKLHCLILKLLLMH